MRTRVLMGLAGGVLFLAGLIAGAVFTGGLPVFASSTTTKTVATATTKDAAGYCQLYETKLAQDLGVKVTALDSANEDALQTVINQMAKDGKITAAQKDQLLKQVQQLGNQPCTALGKMIKAQQHGQRAAWGGTFNQTQLSHARTAIESAVASKLGISTATLQSDLAAGQTIPQIAQARHVTLSTVNSTYLSAVHTQLARAVTSGAMTQAESDMAYSAIQAAVSNGQYPLLEQHGWTGTFPQG